MDLLARREHSFRELTNKLVQRFGFAASRDSASTDDIAPDDIASGDNTSGNNTSGDDTSGGNTSEGNVSEDGAPEGSTSENSASSPVSASISSSASMAARTSQTSQAIAALIQTELERLRDERLQSDARFAEVYVHSRAQRFYGPLRIKAELRERGISDTVIAASLQAAAIDWQANLQQLIHTRFGRKPAADFKEKAKRLRFLQYRGFYTEDVGDL